ncbi:MAG: YceD family protein [Dehalococcoidia bacterium]
MEFNVAQLLRESIGSRRVYHVKDHVQAEKSATVDIEGQVVLLRTDRSILVTAELTTGEELSCSRCLALAQVPLALDIEEEYYPTVDVVSGATLPRPEEPAAFLIDAHHALVFDEAIRQHLVMAEPMQPLCRPDCAGLCPECGADRNGDPCHCQEEPIDARWTALRNLAIG